MKIRQEPPKLPLPKRTVNVISGGEEINGMTYTVANKVSKITVTHGKRVRHVLEEDSNTFDDADDVLIPHNDELAYLSNPPLLNKLKDGEKLLIYLVVSEVAVSDVLVREDQGTWTLFTDGSSNVKGAGLGIILVPPAGETIRQAIKCHPITNNEAEYEVVIAGLELARELGIEQVIIKSASQLVVNQMQGTYTAREARM
uniref:Uncharacterized protein LOC104224900 n=1 Tax=Nicotiana sylvestris TaxID=4096 RepID=A0A1U7WJT2_NICSY|nr:PREDICTED: uncharacterized protein LOC104224900 [Nicotiana sylvestris]